MRMGFALKGISHTLDFNKQATIKINHEDLGRWQTFKQLSLDYAVCQKRIIQPYENLPRKQNEAMDEDAK